jgi:hypothetical protein
MATSSSSDLIADLPETARLPRVDASRNMSRFYTLSVE